MGRMINRIGSALLSACLLSTSATAENVSSAKHTAALADFGAKIEALEQVVDDIALAAALALLTNEFPDWTFGRTSAFDGADVGLSNDLGAIAGIHEYRLKKIRGAIFRNQSVSDEQLERGLEIFATVKAFVQIAYEIEDLVDVGSIGPAGEVYRTVLLNRVEELKEKIRPLSDEIELAVKFSAL